jgi:hypothetical protein
MPFCKSANKIFLNLWIKCRDSIDLFALRLLGMIFIITSNVALFKTRYIQMAEKLEKALGSLQQSVERLETACKERAQKMSQHPAPASKSASSQPQNDLFGAMSQQNNDNVDRKAMAAVLDRTISRVEKLVGEGR